jgi:hypothetical protein
MKLSQQTHNNRRTVECVVFYTAYVVSKESFYTQVQCMCHRSGGPNAPETAREQKYARESCGTRNQESLRW